MSGNGETPRPGFPRARSFLQTWWRTGLTFVLGILLTLGAIELVNWLTRPKMALDQKSVEQNWNATITSLGVSPIFPPEEDLVVGDVLAVVTDDVDADPLAEADRARRRAFVSKSVKLAHINEVAAELDAAYSTLPVFPATFPAGASGPYRDMVVARKFTDAVMLGSLPRAAFPKLRIQGFDAASANLATTTAGAGSYAASSEDLEEFELSDVRTYGLTSVKALELLKKYCGTAPGTCSEATARQHLERVVGPRVNNRYINIKTGKSEYAMTVEVVMVYRVYLTSSIVDLRRTQRERRGILSMLWPFGSSQPADPPSPPPGPAQPAANQTSEKDGNTGKADPNTIKALSNRIDELQQKMASIQNGAALGYDSFFGNESSLQGRFERPVAIGYRSVKFDFDPEAIKN
jgi:hypothetical protein